MALSIRWNILSTMIGIPCNRRAWPFSQAAWFLWHVKWHCEHSHLFFNGVQQTFKKHNMLTWTVFKRLSNTRNGLYVLLQRLTFSSALWYVRFLGIWCLIFSVFCFALRLLLGVSESEWATHNFATHEYWKLVTVKFIFKFNQFKKDHMNISTLRCN